MATIPNCFELFQPRADVLQSSFSFSKIMTLDLLLPSAASLVPRALPLTGSTLSPSGAPPHRVHP